MDEHGGAAAHPHSNYPWYTNEGKRAGLRGFLTSTNHKRIGILYLVPVLSFFTVAVILGRAHAHPDALTGQQVPYGKAV